MTTEQFESILREFKYREPFQLFVIETDDQGTVLIDDPEAIAFAGGAGGFIGSDEIYFFDSAHVRQIRPASPQEAVP